MNDIMQFYAPIKVGGRQKIKKIHRLVSQKQKKDKQK